MACANFLQTDPKWSGQYYAGYTIYSAGCGATAAANVIYTKNKTITPANTAKWLEDNGHTVVGAGTTWEGIVKVCEHYGMKAKQLGYGLYGQTGTTSELEWKKQMKTGKYYGILLMGLSMFTSGGHYITAESYDGSVVDIHDPYSPGLSYKHPWSDFNGKVKVFYLIEKPNTTVKTIKNAWLYKKDYTGAYYTKIPKGSNVTYVKDVKYGFSQVTYGGHTGYVYNSTLNKTGLSKCPAYKCIHKTWLYPNTDTGSTMTRDKSTKVRLPLDATGTLFCITDDGKGAWARVSYQGKAYWVLSKRICRK